MTIHSTADTTVAQFPGQAQEYLGLSDQEALAALPEDTQAQLLEQYNDHREDVPDYDPAESVTEIPDSYAADIDLTYGRDIDDSEIIEAFLDHADGHYVCHAQHGTHQTNYISIELAASDVATAES